ncbi:LppP/LprE family lipoprotein [Mycolicibacterium hodleri]|nr:LppP/LprE family lipoprotein [Mycolicibacterium hodleri]
MDAVRSLAPYPDSVGPAWAWSTESQYFEGNYDPCATLSTALVTVQGATASSPITALMFHNGRYLGTATSKAYGFTTLDTDRTTDDTVVLDYKTPGECNACAPAALNSVRYHWQGNHVAMLDPAPPSF